MSSPASQLQLLLVEDSESDAALVVREFQRGGFAVQHLRVQTADALRAALPQQPWDAIICDFSLPGFGASSALDELRKTGLDLPFLLVSGTIPDQSAVDLMRQGAHDYILKDNLARLVPAMQRELKEASGRRERREMEAQLRQIQKMEAIGQLSGGVAHDFNNILTVIKGNAALLETDPALPAELRDFVTEISRAAKRAAKLTGQLLAFSRRQNLHTSGVDLHESISNLLKMLQRLVGEHITMRMNFIAGSANVFADPSMLDQVILNLVVNARDAMPGGGRIELETEICEINARAAAANPNVRPGHFVRLTVRDTGCGMTPEVRARIFEPFFTTKDVGKGTGLGLAVVYGIVSQHKGWIEVDSEPGRGSTFRLYLPHAPGSNPPIDASRQPALERGGNETILVVEDELTVRQFVRTVLVRLGYQVHEASSGRQALALWPELRDRVQLVVTDIVMPDGIGGRELARQLGQDMPGLPVLFMSGYSTENTGPDFLLEPGLNFMPKPFSPREIAVAVRRLLDENRPAPSR